MDTRTHILDTGEALMKRTGFSGFSYADIAKAVGIRKASIHYHFPSKADLALAAVARYRQRMAESLAGVPPSQTDVAPAIEALGGIFEAAFRGEGGGCLCGSLAADWPALPEPIQAEIRAYWRETTDWIRGAIEATTPDASVASASARLVFALFEGAMLSARVEGDAQIFRAATTAALQLIRPAA